MISELELVERIERLETAALHHWVARGWVMPHVVDNERRFDALDVARVCLICDLHYDLEIAEDDVPVVLSLVDQLHTNRRTIRALAEAIAAEAPEVRDRIRARAQGWLAQ